MSGRKIEAKIDINEIVKENTIDVKTNITHTDKLEKKYI